MQNKTTPKIMHYWRFILFDFMIFERLKLAFQALLSFRHKKKAEAMLKE